MFGLKIACRCLCWLRSGDSAKWRGVGSLGVHCVVKGSFGSKLLRITDLNQKADKPKVHLTILVDIGNLQLNIFLL
jgi:hypothetical protein